MLFDKTTEYPKRSTPGLRDEMRYIRKQGLVTFENSHQPGPATTTLRPAGKPPAKQDGSL
ncbi:hypothetical protein DAPPUDRAFT_264949 [Daphnia pulex]|uniref:Uncharacterized protein n=1 Tax=Daphnia pulex TaxID=6669 RepID=E9HSL3_DAPPU|nr:hypothetical protein DAPPUDRAFT_264949 [Daphnia pulex]|eukprot:EFX65249.1 hypothetical protein DAPPUDRAFT_264949 [Daphnia pulex]